MKKLFILFCLLIANPLAAEVKVLAFAGSVRDESCNKKLLKDAADIASEMGAKVTIIDLKEYPLPFYDSELEAKQGMPQNARKIRELMIESNAIIIASPEYNGSVSALLKNVIDWASRSYDAKPSREAFLNKKFAIMSASPSPMGGKNGLKHLRNILEAIGGTVVPTEVCVPEAYNAFQENGKLKDSLLQEKLKEEMQQLLR